jgi:DNA-directed RNA polymerase subunit omega
MARITVEDCLENITNRFVLVRLTAKRAKQILAGDTAVTDSKGNKSVVTALREIADGKVRFATEDVDGSEEELAIEEVLEATPADTASPEAS